MPIQAQIANCRLHQKGKTFSIKSRLKSFTYAFNGFKLLLLYEHNIRIHIGISVIVLIAGLLAHLSNIEWIIILIMMCLVLVTEIINTAIEYLSDYVSPQFSEKIKNVKDLSAAAVLTSSVFAAIVGIIIFLSKII